ncbi:hypothetical protein BDV24DRAFT_6364 [Aspergillus arachidicola]|uniref:Uncharacterized protein n=1 Tax=Aspergillus arachidicola TaxID=656916 RepID=A0A5N6XQV8_9EURO|nr:hypothetical protein BDV24DRAFT_6364 [Aspergillus arachidicola]
MVNKRGIHSEPVRTWDSKRAMIKLQDIIRQAIAKPLEPLLARISHRVSFGFLHFPALLPLWTLLLLESDQPGSAQIS